LYFLHCLRCSTSGKFKKIQTRHFHLPNKPPLHSVHSEKPRQRQWGPLLHRCAIYNTFYPNHWAHDILSCNLTASEQKPTEALLTQREYVHIYANLSTFCVSKSQSPHISNCMTLYIYHAVFGPTNSYTLISLRS
jgi:hypothetical protein